MRCRVSISREGSQVLARCPEFPECSGRGSTREEALSKLRASVTFWLEACACDQTAAPGLEFEVVRDLH
jgi:predicted RNase H-like HicB family nuclease